MIPAPVQEELDGQEEEEKHHDDDSGQMVDNSDFDDDTIMNGLGGLAEHDD